MLANERIAELEAELAKLKGSIKRCGGCDEPLGKNYYSDVPTPGGKRDLCLTCHTNRANLPSR